MTSGTACWALFLTFNGRVRHVVPEEDLLPHRISWDCECSPDMEWLYAEGGVRWGRIYRHKAYDRRP